MLLPLCPLRFEFMSVTCTFGSDGDDMGHPDDDALISRRKRNRLLEIIATRDRRHLLDNRPRRIDDP